MLIAGCALAVTLPGIGNGFVYDDLPAIVDNPLVHSLSHSLRIWTSAYWPLGLLYRPLTVQLFALEWWIGGGSPLPFHAANAALYLLVSLLVYRIARRLLPSAPGAALAAGLLFAGHPVHVEVTANAVGQSELLAALFVLIGLDRYLAWRQEPSGFTAGRRGALVACYALAIAAKETGYGFPLLLLAAAVLLPGPRSRRESLRTLRPVLGLLLAAGAAALLVRVILFGGLAGEIPSVPLRGLGFAERAFTMLAVVPEWARLLVWPLHLQAHYGPPELPVGGGLTGRHLAGLALLGLLAAGFLRSRRAPVLGLGLAGIVIGLLPVSNLAAPTGILLAERTLFLPSVGFALAAGWLVAELMPRLTVRPIRGTSLVIAGAALLAFGLVRSVERTRVWKDQDTFFARLERDASGSYRAHLTAGIYYARAGRPEEAARAYQRAWSLYRDDPAVFEEYGQLYRVQGRCDRALPLLTEGVRRHPTATVLRARLIECALTLGDTGQARAIASEAIARGQPEFASTLKRLER